MSKTTGITRYSCDRCGKQAYLADGDPRSSTDWRDVSRITSDNVTSGYLLCGDCYAQWKKLAATHDSEFNKYLTNTTTATGE